MLIHVWYVDMNGDENTELFRSNYKGLTKVENFMNSQKVVGRIAEYVVVSVTPHSLDEMLQELKRDIAERNNEAICRTCGATYADGSDGYDGECPSCADKTADRIDAELIIERKSDQHGKAV